MFSASQQLSFSRGACMLAALVTLAAATPAMADDVHLEASSIDGGGGRSTSGTLVLVGTIGQPDPGWASADTLFLSGGFWWPDPRPASVCPADFDGNQSVDFSDLLVVLASWGGCDACPADLNGSGAVDFSDLVTVLAAWGPCD